MAQEKTETKVPKVTYDTLGQALYNLVSFFEGYDQQVLSMCMRAFELTLGFSQSQLSMLATVSTMSRMGCCIIWGLLADKHHSNLVLGGGLLVMGMASIFLSSASHYKIKIVADSAGSEKSTATSGTPQPDSSSEENGSRASTDAKSIFTILQALNCIGRLLCAVITTLIARKILLGYYGWRTSYAVLGYIWILFGVGIVFGMEGHKPSSSNGAHTGQQQLNAAKDPKFADLLEGAAKAVFMTSTTWLLIFTIFIAEAPMCAFNYMTIYLQYLGVSDTMAGVAIAITLIGGAVGSVAGGKAIKKMVDLSKEYGELGSGIAVMVVRLLVCLLFFLGKAPSGKLLWYHYIELATLGGTLVTLGGVDRELMKKSIEDKHQGTAAAMIRTISGIASSVILFQVCAYLTEKVFGYVPSRESFETMATDIKEKNAEALRKSMMYIILAGTLINTVCYCTLFGIYPTHMQDVKKKNEGNNTGSESQVK